MQRAAWTLLPHDFTSSLTLSLTLSREQLLKLSVSCFFPPRCRPCGWSCHQFSPRPCFNTSPGITASWADIYIYSFYTDFFSSLNLFLGRLTCREEAHGASQPAELCSKAVRTVFKNASSGFSLWGAQNTLESSFAIYAKLENAKYNNKKIIKSLKKQRWYVNKIITL